MTASAPRREGHPRHRPASTATRPVRDIDPSQASTSPRPRQPTSGTFGDGTTGTGATPTAHLATPATYNVSAHRPGRRHVHRHGRSPVYAPATGTVTVTAPTTTPTPATTVKHTTTPPGTTSRSRSTARTVKVATGTYSLSSSLDRRRRHATYPRRARPRDVVVACVETTCGTPGALKPGAGSTTIDWTYKPGADGFAELWDGESPAGWTAVGTGTVAKNYLTSRRPPAGRQAPIRAPCITRCAVQGLRALRRLQRRRDQQQRRRPPALPAAGRRSPTPTAGYQVAILDNGSAAATRAGALTQERPDDVVRHRRCATTVQAHPRVEHAQRSTPSALADHVASERRARERLPRGQPQRRRRLHRPRERRQQPHVPQRAHARSSRPTRSRRRSPSTSRPASHSAPRWG